MIHATGDDCIYNIYVLTVQYTYRSSLNCRVLKSVPFITHHQIKADSTEGLVSPQEHLVADDEHRVQTRADKVLQCGH